MLGERGGIKMGIDLFKKMVSYFFIGSFCYLKIYDFKNIENLVVLWE